ncbi:MAG: ERCC4 domain-containing protein [Candidatus Hydrothermarchaeota archaeon]
MLEIIVDKREMRSFIPDLLAEKGIGIKVEHLTVADYIVSDRIAVERKGVSDFLNSLFKGRLFDQINRLKDAYEKPILVLEGHISEHLIDRMIEPNAVWGCLARLQINMEVPVFQTLNSRETADLLVTLCKREQEERNRVPNIRPKPKLLTLREKQTYLITGLPEVGPMLAKRLLEEFGTPRKVLTSNEKTLTKVKGIGKKTAKKIIEVLDTPYKRRPYL